MNIKNAKEFIKNNLNKIIKIFPEFRFRYEFSEIDCVHSIEVSPYNVYNSNDNFIKWENDFINNFEEKFPYQYLYFIPDNVIIGIRKAEFEIIGEKYIDESVKEIVVTKNSFNIEMEPYKVKYNSNYLEIKNINSYKNIINIGISTINIKTIFSPQKDNLTKDSLNDKIFDNLKSVA